MNDKKYSCGAQQRYGDMMFDMFCFPNIITEIVKSGSVYGFFREVRRAVLIFDWNKQHYRKCLCVCLSSIIPDNAE